MVLLEIITKDHLSCDQCCLWWTSLTIRLVPHHIHFLFGCITSMFFENFFTRYIYYFQHDPQPTRFSLELHQSTLSFSINLFKQNPNPQSGSRPWKPHWPKHLSCSKHLHNHWSRSNFSQHLEKKEGNHMWPTQNKWEFLTNFQVRLFKITGAIIS